MKIIVIRQPWAWAIFHAGKDVENRSWNTKYRGPLLIQAAAQWHKEEWRSFLKVESQHPKIGRLVFGAIIGVVDLVDTYSTRDEQPRGGQWEMIGYIYHWILKKPRQFAEPIPCKGAQKLWTPDEETMEKVRAQL